MSVGQTATVCRRAWYVPVSYRAVHTWYIPAPKRPYQLSNPTPADGASPAAGGSDGSRDRFALLISASTGPQATRSCASPGRTFPARRTPSRPHPFCTSRYPAGLCSRVPGEPSLELPGFGHD